LAKNTSLKKKGVCEEILRKNRLVTEEELLKAIAKAEETGEYLHQVVVDMGLAKRTTVLEAFARELGVNFDLLNEELDSKIVMDIPRAMEERDECIPIGKTEDTLIVAMADPYNPFVLNDIKVRTQYHFKVQQYLAFPRDIRKKLEEIYGKEKEEEALYKLMQDDMAELAAEEIEQDESFVGEREEVDLISSALEEAQRAPVMRLVDKIIAQAIRDGSTDIHIEPFSKETKLRYRIDGDLQPRPSPPRSWHNAIVSRIKILAKADIAERRKPLDGRISVNMGEKKYELRVSIIPTIYGESVVMRILNKSSTALSLSDLGFGEKNLELIKVAINKPHGLILVSGPTGSGKSTTLFSALNTIYSPEIKILTIENPVEYNLDGVVQVQTKEEIGLTFALGLRAFLRQDPDVIMVGEIRDPETAGIAIQAALTGHLVLSTIHTNDASSCVTRLANFKVDPFLITDAVQLLIAQRLVRKVCKDCKEPVEPTDEEIELLNSHKVDTSNLQLYKGKGCPKCSGKGLKGRTGIHELLVLDNEIKELILKEASAYEIKEAAIGNGMRTLLQDGLEKITRGITTFEEIRAQIAQE
jgi:type IV pilus assembly protein PilB